MGILLLVAMQSASPSFGPAKRDFTSCVERRAMNFERAGEPVDSTIQAAFDACVGERMAFEAAIENYQRRLTKQSDEEKRRARDGVVKVVVESLTMTLRVRLMEKRSGS